MLDDSFQRGQADRKDRLMLIALGRRLLFKHRDEPLVAGALKHVYDTLKKGLGPGEKELKDRLAPWAVSVEEADPRNISEWARIARISTANVELLVRHVALDYGFDDEAYEDAQIKLHHLYKQSLRMLRMIVKARTDAGTGEGTRIPTDMTHRQVGPRTNYH